MHTLAYLEYQSLFICLLQFKNKYSQIRFLIWIDLEHHLGILVYRKAQVRRKAYKEIRINCLPWKNTSSIPLFRSKLIVHTWTKTLRAQAVSSINQLQRPPCHGAIRRVGLRAPSRLQSWASALSNPVSLLNLSLPFKDRDKLFSGSIHGADLTIWSCMQSNLNVSQKRMLHLSK